VKGVRPHLQLEAFSLPFFWQDETPFIPLFERGMKGVWSNPRNRTEEDVGAPLPIDTGQGLGEVPGPEKALGVRVPGNVADVLERSAQQLQVLRNLESVGDRLVLAVRLLDFMRTGNRSRMG